MMHKDYKIKRVGQSGIVAVVVAFAFIFVTAGTAWTANGSLGHSAKAEMAAKKARAEAQKAIAEAQKAIAEADATIRKAQLKSEKARKSEKDAFQKMVAAGYYPSDITLTAPNGRVHAVFSHKKHLLRENLKCTQCHPKIFIMKVGDKNNVRRSKAFTMANMRKGKYCGTCHNGKKAFSVADLSSCKRCHPKQL